MPSFSVKSAFLVLLCNIAFGFVFRQQLQEQTQIQSTIATLQTQLRRIFQEPGVQKDTNTQVERPAATFLGQLTKIELTETMLTSRGIAQVFKALEQSEGAGARVRRSIGTPKLRNFSPFLMLDHFTIGAGAGFPDHPHRYL